MFVLAHTLKSSHYLDSLNVAAFQAVVHSYKFYVQLVLRPHLVHETML